MLKTEISQICENTSFKSYKCYFSSENCRGDFFLKLGNFLLKLSGHLVDEFTLRSIQNICSKT